MPLKELARNLWIDGYNQIDPVEGRRDIFVQLIMRGDTDCDCKAVKHLNPRKYKELILDLIEFGVTLRILDIDELVNDLIGDQSWS